MLSAKLLLCCMAVHQPVAEYECLFLTAAERRKRLGSADPDPTKMVIDSGATKHCFHDINMFTSITEHNPKITVKISDGSIIHPKAIGNVTIKLRDRDGNIRDVHLTNCLFMPQCPVNLLSCKQLWKTNRIATTFTNRAVFKCKHTGARYDASLLGKHYSLESFFMASSTGATAGVSSTRIDNAPDPLYVLAHKIMGHASDERMAKTIALNKGLSNFKAFKGLGSHKWCDACQAGASKPPISRKPRGRVKVIKHYTYFGQRISSDLCDVTELSFGRHRHMVCFIDSYTRYCEIYFLQTKHADEVLGALKRFQHEYSKYLKNGVVTKWHTDNGGEFESADIEKFCKRLHIEHSRSVQYIPETNGLAERFWGMLIRPMRVLLADSGMSHRFWTYAAEHAKMLHNVMPTTSLPGFVSPHFMLYKEHFDMSDVRIWGVKCFFHLPPPDRNKLFKLDSNSAEASHLGYDFKRRAYIIHVPQLNRITTGDIKNFRQDPVEFLSSDNQFTSSPNMGKHSAPQGFDIKSRRERVQIGEAGTSRCDIDLDTEGFSDVLPCNAGDGPGSEKCVFANGHDGLHSWQEFNARSSDPLHERISGRTRSHYQPQAPAFLPAGYEMAHMAFHTTIKWRPSPDQEEIMFAIDYSALGSIPIPNHYKDAMASKLFKQWKEAVEKEITALLENKTWEWKSPLELPAGRKVIKSRFVFTVKYLRDGTVERFKARFVCCGYSQIHGADYDRAFSATLRATSFRLLLAIAANKRHKLFHIDVRNAFTQAYMDKEIWADGPEGHSPKCPKSGKPMLIKLLRALYGTKQAGRLWQEKLRKTLIDIGFKPSISEPCLLYYSSTKGEIRMGVYVDDIIFAASNDAVKDWFVKQFRSAFSTTECIPLSWFLGIAIDQHDDGSVSIGQSKYIRDCLDKFIPNHASLSIKKNVPYVGDHKKVGKLTCAQSDEERDFMADKEYMQIIGSLLWLSVMSRPEINYIMSVLCAQMQDPSRECLEAAHGVLLYLGKTQNQCITYGQPKVPRWTSALHSPSKTSVPKRWSGPLNYGFHAYSDSSWGDVTPRYGYLVFLAGGVVAFVSKKLKSADSSCEAEYSAACMCSRELYFLRGCCEDLGLDIQGPILLLSDNSAAMDIAYNHGVTALSKHYERAMHWLREGVQYNRFVISHCDTEVMLADITTKANGSQAFCDLNAKIHSQREIE